MVRLFGIGGAGIVLLAWLAAGPAGSEKRLSGPVGGLATSERDPLKELQGRVAALEQENRALAERLAKLEGAVSVGGGNVTLRSAGTLRIQASRIDAAAATSSFSGALKAESVSARTVSAETVTANTVTPAAGNVW